MTHVIDWDGAYRQDRAPAWNIGAPQPAFAELIDQDGTVRGDVLDAGCGYAELALTLAARGHAVVGIDLTATAVAAAQRAAEERGLTTASFAQADITALTGFDGRFSTIFDSGLLHALPADRRDDYLKAMHRAAAPDASFYILAFGAGAFTGHDGPAPAQFTEDGLRQLVSQHWRVNEVRPTELYASDEAQGRIGLPGFLVIAEKE